jgi:MYXO-CTERM domain-containing protein
VRSARGLLVVSLALVGLTSAAEANGRYPSAGQLVVDPADARHIVVRTTFGLLQTFDAGSSWSLVCEQAVSPQGFEDPELVVTTGGRIAMGLPDGLAVGDQTGCQWSRAAEFANDDVIDLVVNGSDPARAYLAAAVTVKGAFNALVAGTTDGVIWTGAGALLADTYPLTIETARSRPQRLYLGAEDGNLELGFIDVSDDGGATWTMHAGPDGVDSVYVSAVDPQDADRLYLRSYFPQSSLYVSDDGAATWTSILQSDVALTGFALSPDGQQVAVGGSNGVTILGRTFGDAGSVYAAVTDNPLAVSCLTWTASGLYACADEATAGFTIGISIDGGRTFAPLLHLKDLTAAACAPASSAGLCEAQWCSTAAAIGASCAGSSDGGSDANGDAKADTKGDSGGESVTTDVGCGCRMTGDSSWLGVIFVLVAAVLRGNRRRGRVARGRLQPGIPRSSGSMRAPGQRMRAARPRFQARADFRAKPDPERCS